jgi:hypothetical protein
MKLCLCGNPQHYGVTPVSISKARAVQIWAARGCMHKLTLTAPECETVMQLWDRLSGDDCWMSAFHRIRCYGSVKALSFTRPVNPGPYQPRMLVCCGYREGHVGRVLRVDDPRAWAGTLAFPESNPDPERVRAHVSWCRATGLLSDGKVPVLWSFGKVYWDRDLRLCSPERAAWHDWHQNANAPVLIHDYQQGQLALARGVES